MAKRAVITGGTSFIGRYVTRELSKTGWEVFALVRPDSANKTAISESEHVHMLLCNLDETDQWTKTIGHADVFLHFAWDGVGAKGRADVLIQKKNIERTLLCLKAAAALGVKRFLFAGSQAEYGKCSGVIRETTPCSPVLEYGKGKLAVWREAGKLAGQLGIEYIHMRIFSVYGEGDHPWTLVESCINTFVQGGDMELSDCTQKWNFLHVKDAARAICALCDTVLAESGSIVLNVAGTDTRVLRQFVEAIYTAAGKKGRVKYGARRGNTEKVIGIEPDISRLLSMIDWRPMISFEEGVGEMVKRIESKPADIGGVK